MEDEKDYRQVTFRIPHDLDARLMRYRVKHGHPQAPMQTQKALEILISLQLKKEGF